MCNVGSWHREGSQKWVCMMTPSASWKRLHACRSEAESNRASCGATNSEKHGLEQELWNSRAREAALSARVRALTAALICCCGGTSSVHIMSINGHND